jgi:hypothetical protein
MPDIQVLNTFYHTLLKINFPWSSVQDNKGALLRQHVYILHEQLLNSAYDK